VEYSETELALLQTAKTAQAASLWRCDFIPIPNLADRWNLSPESTAVEQTLDPRLARQFVQVIARFAQGYARIQKGADAKLFTGQPQVPRLKAQQPHQPAAMSLRQRRRC